MSRPPRSAAAWAHPSVRDTVIEYLTDHDRERQRFLSTATAGGVLLALSTLPETGGPPGRLLRTPADWQALGTAVSAIAGSGDSAAQEALLRGTGAALDACTAGSRAAAGAEGLARVLLRALSRTWQARPPAGLTPGLLESFYDLAVRVRYLVAGPDVSPAWRQAGDRLRTALRGEVTAPALAAAAHWARLASVVRSNQPHFARIYGAGIGEQAGQVQSWLSQWAATLEAAGEGNQPAAGPGPAPPGPDGERRHLVSAAILVLAELGGLTSGAAARAADRLGARLGAWVRADGGAAAVQLAARTAGGGGRPPGPASGPAGDVPASDVPAAGAHRPGRDPFDIAAFFADL